MDGAVRCHHHPGIIREAIERYIKVAPKSNSNFSKSSTEFYTKFSARENGMGIFKKILIFALSTL